MQLVSQRVQDQQRLALQPLRLPPLPLALVDVVNLAVVADVVEQPAQRRHRNSSMLIWRITLTVAPTLLLWPLQQLTELLLLQLLPPTVVRLLCKTRSCKSQSILIWNIGHCNSTVFFAEHDGVRRPIGRNRSATGTIWLSQESSLV